ncbi:uncharacterized protein LOC141734652 isoform X3 [Larus michahellis]|uniref:uncharacterized protein LOC141734652 isoform X3 n=1 Tax=Larus michahellis TaxID=119627 RepID=UPI003D9AE2BC
MALPRAPPASTPPPPRGPCPHPGATEGQRDRRPWATRPAGAEGSAGRPVAPPASGCGTSASGDTASPSPAPRVSPTRVCVFPPPPALWEATRVLMLLSVLTAAAGLALGLSAVASAARRVRARVAGITLLLAGLLALLGLAVYTAGTLSLLGPARTAWRFSWSYILGWVAVVLIGSAGLFHLCAAAKDPSPESSEVAGP